MADRKQFMGAVPADADLLRALEQSRTEPVSDELLREQRISFAFGNAPSSATRITKESVRETSQRMQLLSKQ